jgi:hypothetical protein
MRFGDRDAERAPEMADAARQPLAGLAITSNGQQPALDQYFGP